MAAVMHPRGHFVEQGTLGADEELDGHHPDIVEGLDDLAGQSRGIVDLARDRRTRRYGRQPQDTGLVDVLRRWPEPDLATGRTAEQKGEFGCEVDPPLEQPRCAVQCAPGLGGVARAVDPCLALAVIAE